LVRAQVILMSALLCALVPLFTNCERGSAPRSGSSLEPRSEATFTLGSKVELDASTLVRAPQTLASARATGKVFKSSSTDYAVAAGTQLMVVLDKACLVQAGGDKTKQVLSTQTLATTATHEASDLRIQAFSVQLDAPKLVAELADEAESDDCVLQVANNVIVSVGPPAPASQTVQAAALTNDPALSQLTHLSLIKATAGWDTFFSPGRGITKDVVVAVIDSGVDYNHPDLNANMWRSAAGKYGKDFFNDDDDPMDDNEHGTHVAGLIGAVSNNGVGVAGVMGKQVKIMAVKALSADGSGTATEIINGIRWAADQGADVINLSVELTGASTPVRDALLYASQRGVVITVAAGNSGKEITSSKFVAPAGYCPDVAGAISVASVDTKTGNLSDFSNYSSTYVMIGAPGSEDSVQYLGVISTVPGNKYKRLEGTSMASPVVAGAAALVIGVMKSNNFTVSNSGVALLLRTSATANSALSGKVAGSVTLNLERLARAVKWRYLIEGDGGTETPY
jgi:subtilisin family serine protease